MLIGDSFHLKKILNKYQTEKDVIENKRPWICRFPSRTGFRSFRGSRRIAEKTEMPEGEGKGSD